MGLLEELSLPEGLKKLSQKELYSISEEIRARIIEVVAQNGGHLASNLGVVEMTVAIHAALSSGKDKVIFDVSHQSYAHKLLTGRLDQFHTIRQYKGISGFTKRSESEHDVFGAGHAATSISAALGIAKARDLAGEKFAVLSLIGDASLSSGEAFEAINNVRSVKGPFIVVLNDNKMSISSPVGMLSEHITSLRYNALYRGFKKKIERLMLKLPEVGDPLVQNVDKLLRRTKHMLINYQKIGVIYEELGLRYLGPIDGMNIPHILGAIRYAKSASEPVLIHLLSQKGQGYAPAEKDPTRYHGTSQFNTKNGKPLAKPKGRSYTDAFGDQLVKIATKEKKIVAITAAMAEGAGLSKFQRKFPQRFVDVGISEEHAVTFAGGLAVQGMVPVVAIYSTFMQRSFDQLIHDLALQKLPVILALDRAGLVGEDGPTHHGVFDLAFMNMIPDVTILAPSDEAELVQMMNWAVQFRGGPVVIRYPKELLPAHLPVHKHENFRPGVSEKVIWKSQAKLTVVAIGSMVFPTVRAIERFSKDINLINIRSLKPFDDDILKQINEAGSQILTIEEGVIQGGLYSTVCAKIQSLDLNKVHVTGIGIPDNQFIDQGPRSVLLKDCGLDADGIEQQIKILLQKA